MTVERSRDDAGTTERWDRVFAALSAEPRRRLLASLREVPPERPVSLPEAAASPTDPVDRDALRVRLRHRHLPLLSDYGYVRWADDPFHARRGPAFDEVSVVLEALVTNAGAFPERLVRGCHRLERER
ncbi:hypothetical protein [Salinilacihabitans rarus]|uniref:hypothetical protein n=1 Tax=Salinilacihabitans rarus TaxID=2961596 RepID=UPI0020C8F514|nr:hypothetical protein [Salinilacihabitans rarus]